MAAWHVVEANARAIGRSWFGELTPSVLQPLVLALVFAGLLAGSTDRLGDGGTSFPSAQYIVLGVVCVSAAITGAIESAHLTFIGLKLSNKFTTIVTTPTSPWQLAVGNVAWAGLYATGLSAVLLVVLSPLLPWALSSLVAIPAAAVVSGLTSAALAAVLSLFVILSSGSPQVLNVIGRVVVPPLLLFSATLFPLSVLPGWAAGVLGALPIANGAIASRTLFAAQWAAAADRVGVIALWLVAATAAMAWLLDRDLRS